MIWKSYIDTIAFLNIGYLMVKSISSLMKNSGLITQKFITIAFFLNSFLNRFAEKEFEIVAELLNFLTLLCSILKILLILIFLKLKLYLT